MTPKALSRLLQKPLSDSERHLEQLKISRAAETALCGALLRWPDVYSRIDGTISLEHFTDSNCRSVFGAIKSLADASKPVTVYSVGEALNKSGELMDVGGAPFILQLYDSTITDVNVEQYVAMIVEFSRRNKLASLLEALAGKAKSGLADSAEVLTEAERKLSSFICSSSRSEAVPVKSVLECVLNVLADRRKGGGDSKFIETGFDDLDAQTGGLCKGDLTIIAARPSIGKTAIGMNMVENAARNGTKVLVFSLEMSAEQLGERLLSRVTRIRGDRLRSGSISDDEFDKLTTAACEVSPFPIYVADISGISVSAIASLSRRMKLRSGLDMVVIDYLGLIASEDKSIPRHEQIADYTRRLKLLARELHVALVLMCQLNRGAESRSDNVPRLSDLRESGAIEQDADTVILLHRPEFYRPQDRPGEADLIVAKQRNGPVGTVPLVFLKETTSFQNAVKFQSFDQAAIGGW